MEVASEIKKYIDIAKRRFYWVMIPFLVVLLGGLSFALNADPVFEAQTLILVQPQEVPQAYVRSIVQRGIQERLRTITQQVTSRTNLEAIISERGLYEGRGMLMESKVQTLRKNIRVDVGGRGRGGESTFAISFRHGDPELTRDVTNALASNFISENLKIRESHALGTSSFLADELDTVRRRLEEREETLKAYREKHFGAMPEQLQTNLSMLARMQSQIEHLEKSLQDAQNRRLMLQQQIAQQKRMAEQMADFSGNQALFDFDDDSAGFESGQLASLRGQLDELLMRYTENHPDVRRVKSMIEKLEAQEAQETASLELEDNPLPDLEPPAMDMTPMMPSPEDMFRPQLAQVDGEIARLRADIVKSKERLEVYQTRVEQAPKREQEILSLKRDYENLKSLYDSLLNRKLEAELAVSMEKKQKGEQFRILDPAKRPEIPVEPDMRRILLLTLVLGLGLGGGLGYLREITDTSYKEPKEMINDLGLPVLISLPYRYTAQEERVLKLKKLLKAGGVAVGFVGLSTGIVLYNKGIAATIGFVKRVLPFIGT